MCSALFNQIIIWPINRIINRIANLITITINPKQYLHCFCYRFCQKNLIHRFSWSHFVQRCTTSAYDGLQLSCVRFSTTLTFPTDYSTDESRNMRIDEEVKRGVLGTRLGPLFLSSKLESTSAKRHHRWKDMTMQMYKTSKVNWDLSM